MEISQLLFILDKAEQAEPHRTILIYFKNGQHEKVYSSKKIKINAEQKLLCVSSVEISANKEEDKTRMLYYDIDEVVGMSVLEK